jgi:hypothetical protein
MKSHPVIFIVVPRLVSYLNFLRGLCGVLRSRGAEVHLASPAHPRAAGALNRLVEMLRSDMVQAHFSAAIFSTGCREAMRGGIDGLMLRDAHVASLRAVMHRVLDDEGVRQCWSAAALAGRARFIAEQTRIYESVFRTTRTATLAAAAC